MTNIALDAHVTVAAIIEKEQKFLMVEEISDGLTVINQPAGHVEHDESFATAVIRETREETAWQFIPQAVVGVYRWLHPQSGATYYRHCFILKPNLIIFRLSLYLKNIKSVYY